MNRPSAVSPSVLTRLLSQHPSFFNSDVIAQIAPMICAQAHQNRALDLIRYTKAFKAWRHTTRFHPKPSFQANFYLHHPVHEHARYGELRYYRKRHSIGVTFATFVPIDGCETGVVWTIARKAHLFKHNGSTWVCTKTLNRQDIPFRTWMRFLGGEQAYEREHQKNDLQYAKRSPQQLFYDLVVPFYGSAEFARDNTRSIPCTNPIWEIVRAASAMTVSPKDSSRMEWLCMDE